MEIIQLGDDDSVLHKIRKVQQALEEQCIEAMMLPEIFVTSGPVTYRLLRSGTTGIDEIDAFYREDGAVVLVSCDEEHSVAIFLNRNHLKKLRDPEKDARVEAAQLRDPEKDARVEAAQLRALDFIEGITAKAQKQSSRKAVRPRKNRARKPTLTRRMMPCNLFR